MGIKLFFRCRQRAVGAEQMGIGIGEPIKLDPFPQLDQHLHAGLGRPQDIFHGRQNADRNEIFRLWFLNRRFVLDDNKQIAILLQQQLGNVGITLNLQKMDPSQTWDMLINGEYDLSVMYWTNDILDPDRQLSTYYQAGGIGSSNSNQEMSDLIDQGRSELDATVREGIYQEAVKIAYDEAYFVWTVNNQDVYGASEGLQWTPRVDSKILVKEMSLS